MHDHNSSVRGRNLRRSTRTGEQYCSESVWDKLVVKTGVGGQQQTSYLYGRKVDGRPEVVKTAPPEGLRGLVVLSREKFDRYAAMVRE